VPSRIRTASANGLASPNGGPPVWTAPVVPATAVPVISVVAPGDVVDVVEPAVVELLAGVDDAAPGAVDVTVEVGEVVWPVTGVDEAAAVGAG
jgi:hypothetical protein